MAEPGPLDGALRLALGPGLRVHPRLAQQRIGTTPEARARILASLPPLVPFRDEPPRRIEAVLDWDHHLPTQRPVLRLHLLYDEASQLRFEAALEERVRLIAARDLFPEFDLPDFEELPGDESYDLELSPGLAVEAARLTSPWRRAIDGEVADRAVAVVRSSTEFARVREAAAGRAAHLGDLDAVSWMAPCESGHARWTVDVWWLTSFDGRVGTGWSFLVDVEGDEGVVKSREFSVRAG